MTSESKIFTNSHSKDMITPVQEIDLGLFGIQDYSLFVRREDLLHPEISGNKFRKLKYNLEKARELKCTSILTFGGAFSNHLYAVAAAGRESGISTIGIVRGDELKEAYLVNPTLRFCENQGMKLEFVTREQYRQKDNPEFIEELMKKFAFPYILPEGGTNKEAVLGCEEILGEEDSVYDYICTPVGTGGTLSGILNSVRNHQMVVGFSALNTTFQHEVVKNYSDKKNYNITADYAFGGYGKADEVLVSFINEFKRKTGIPLDPVYTGKMMFGIIDRMRENIFPRGSRILAIHTGGLQGIMGMNEVLKKKNLELIE